MDLPLDFNLGPFVNTPWIWFSSRVFLALNIIWAVLNLTRYINFSVFDLKNSGFVWSVYPALFIVLFIVCISAAPVEVSQSSEHLDKNNLWYLYFNIICGPSNVLLVHDLQAISSWFYGPNFFILCVIHFYLHNCGFNFFQAPSFLLCSNLIYSEMIYLFKITVQFYAAQEMWMSSANRTNVV